MRGGDVGAGAGVKGNVFAKRAGYYIYGEGKFCW